MDSLWSMSTIIREANRIYGFLNVAKKMKEKCEIKKHKVSFKSLGYYKSIKEMKQLALQVKLFI